MNNSNAQKTPQVLSADSMGTLIRSTDWSHSTLGALDEWPRSLQTVLRITLDSRFAIWIGWGPDLTFLYNDAYRDMTLGKKHPWALGQPAREVWAEAWKDLGPRVNEVVQYGKATYDEHLLLLLERSGYAEETYHTFSYSPLPDDKGDIGGLLCIVVENTERYLAERRLKVLRDVAARVAEARTSEDLFNTIAECVGAKKYDVPFSLIYLTEPYNENEARLVCQTGIGPAHPAAPATIDVSRSAGPWPVANALWKAETVEINDLAERFHDLPTGSWDIPPRCVIAVPIAQQGQSQPAGVMIIGANPYRPLDDAYKGFINLLAGQVASALADVRAYQAEKRRAEALAEIDRAKTAFFSNTSHELRTPLTLMLGPLEDILARDAEADSTIVRRDEVGLIHRNGLRLLKLVNTLLDFSQIEGGRLRANYEAVNLSTFTAEIASAFCPAMEKAGLKYVIDCVPLPEPAYVDSEMWEKIVLNLISNAFKYTIKGEVTVTVSVSADGKTAQLSVRDTGTGIPAQELPRLFERFHRIEGQVGRTFEGTGIGLALVQELVRLHEGSIRVTSVEGEGSTFTVTIPLGTKAASLDRAADSTRVAPVRPRAQAFLDETLRWLPGEPESREERESDDLVQTDFPGSALDSPVRQERAVVLVVDDNSDMRDYIRRLLSSRYDIELAADGLAALESARRRRPDLILTDVMMPRLDGFGLLRELRSDPELRDAPVVLLSARASEEASIEGLEAGADDYLTKPFSTRELVARVTANLDLSRRRRQVQEELRRVNESLEQRIAAEIAERMKTEEAFRQAQKMEAIGQLTGGIAHDFNNLLQVIVGNLHVLQQRVSTGKFAPSDVERLTGGAIRGAQRAAILTQRLLAFSRRQPLDPKPIEVNRLVTSMSELLRRTLGERIVIETVLSGGLWDILADSNELENALINLAVNSRDAMLEGGRLTIETANAETEEVNAASEEEVRDSQYVMIAVTDTGFGMPADVVAKAFEPFFTTKETGHGTGLGLSQVYGFVKQSGGHIKIFSEPGKGTTVKIFMPRFVAFKREKTSEAPKPPLPVGTKDKVILVVEDDEDVRANSVMMLRELGYKVFEARDGASALRAIEKITRVDLLFTDLGLPGEINGRQLADRLSHQRPGSKVLFTSGYARGDILHQGRLDTKVELISKPFTFDQLATKIQTIIFPSDGFDHTKR
jgi:signal transduction histidine kinase